MVMAWEDPAAVVSVFRGMWSDSWNGIDLLIYYLLSSQ